MLRAARVAFVANCVLDDEGRLAAVGFGHPEVVQDTLARTAQSLYVAPIPAQVDIAIAGVGYPKDQNVYQASRAASYLHFAPTSVVRPGGVIVVPAACPEGPGEGIGEQRFFAAMCEPRQAFMQRMRTGSFQPGEQRAYIMALVLESVSVIFAGVDDPEPLKAMGFLTATSLEARVGNGRRDRRSTSNGAWSSLMRLLTMPVVSGDVGAR